MKRVMFLVATATFLLNARSEESMEARDELLPIKIESPLLPLVDGNPKIIKMGELLSFKNKLHKILSLKMPIKKIPDCTLKKLVDLEEHFSPSERDHILRHLLNQFEHMTQKYLPDLQKVDVAIFEIVDSWKVQRNRINTRIKLLLVKDGTVDKDKNMLYKQIMTLNDFYQFVDDLYLFLNDLSYSLPKSLQLYEAYKAKLAKDQHELNATS